MNFIVTVLCSVHLVSCPIPDGYKKDLKATSKEECEHRAKKAISMFGYAAADFRISCKEK